MNTKDFNKKITSKVLNEDIAARHGFRLQLDRLNIRDAKKMLEHVRSDIASQKKSLGEAAADSLIVQRNQLVVATLSQFITEKSAALAQERREAKLRARLNESSDANHAEAVLAAKDMTDKLQGMVEDLGEMQNEQLSPLVDTIRNAMGEESASAYESAMSAALNAAMDCLRQARQDADTASRVLTGEEEAGETLGDDPLGGDDLDMGDDLGADDAFGASDAAVGGEEPLGRETRDELG